MTTDHHCFCKPLSGQSCWIEGSGLVDRQTDDERQIQMLWESGNCLSGSRLFLGELNMRSSPLPFIFIQTSLQMILKQSDSYQFTYFSRMTRNCWDTESKGSLLWILGSSLLTTISSIHQSSSRLRIQIRSEPLFWGPHLIAWVMAGKLYKVIFGVFVKIENQYCKKSVLQTTLDDKRATAQMVLNLHTLHKSPE